MKSTYLSNLRFVLVLISISISSFISAQWIRKADGLKPRSELGETIVYNSRLYNFVGFSDTLRRAEPSSEVYNPATNTWSYIASMPANTAMTHQDVILIDNTIWLIGGRVGQNPGPMTSAIWIYNITTNTWSRGPEILDPATEEPMVIAGSGAALLGRVLHIFGGFTPTACIDQNQYHLTLDVDTWLTNQSIPAQWENKLAPLPLKRNHLSALVLGGKIYALGGQSGHDCGNVDVAYCHVYNPSTDSWRQLPSPPTPRSHAEGSTFAIDGKIYLVGGQGSAGSTKYVTIFDPEGNNGAGTWTENSSLTLPYIYEGLSSRIIGSTFIISHGSQGTSKFPLKQTYTRIITRNPVHKLGFPSECLNLNDSSGSSLKGHTWLYTIDSTKNYTTSSNASWLTVTKNAAGIASPNAVDIEVTADTTGLAPGTYNATVTATGTGSGTYYTPATLCVNLTVHQKYQSGSPLVTNIVSTTGRTYTLSQLVVGATVYTDRTYAATTVPANLNNASFIKTANDDKANATATLFSFNINQNATVYIAYDPRATVLPAWLSGFQKLTTQIGVNDSKITYMELYSKNYAAGTVSLGGNLQSPAAGALNNYFVIVVPQAAPIQYTLTVSTTGNGVVIKNPNQATYASGTSVTLTATPAAGQQFTGWSGAATGIVNPLTVTMNANKSITAAFTPIQYNLTVTISGSGTVTKNPNQTTYASGTSVTLTVAPAAGQQFTGWSGAASGTVNPLTITMDANKSITATFAPTSIQYTLSITTSGNGTVTKNPNQATYATGTSVTLTATPAAGQQFTGWSGAASGTVNPLTIIIDANKSITATFASTPIQYNLTITTSGNGTVTKNPNQASYASGTSVTLTAAPAAGQQFTGWSGAATGTVNPLTVTMDANKSITATFAPIQYGLTVTISGNGTVSRNPNQATYASGTSVTLTATPATGQQFTGWSGAATGTVNPLTIVMDANKSITATFVPIQYDTLTTSGSGTVTKNPNQATYASGTSVTLTAIPAAGQQFTGWSGAATGTVNPLTIVMDANKSITATFVPIQYDLTLTTSGSGTVTKNPNQATYASGTSVTLTAIPAAGQQFTGWSGAATGTVNPLTITMDANKSITATFVPIQYNLTLTTSGNGTVTKNPDQATYASGTSVTLTATPAAGQQFTGWSGAATGTGNPLTIVMDAHKSITATFVPIQYNLTLTTSGNGTVTKNPDQATYASGTSVTLTAIPAAVQQFTGWSGAATGAVNPLTITMDRDKTITATFVQIPLVISNITTTTGRSYTLGQLIVGTTVYTDKVYQASTVPANLNNAPLIKTPNDDKANKSAILFSFSINQSATIYVAYDSGAKTLPAWLSGWQKLTGQQIGLNDVKMSYMQLYSKVYPAGTVSLGGNLQSPAVGAQSNYFVVVKAVQSQQRATNYSHTGNQSGSVISEGIDQDIMQTIKNSTLKFKIYPNPNPGDKIHIEANNFSKHEMVTITLRDALGRVIRSMKVTADGMGAFSGDIQTKHIGKGLYILNAISISKNVQRKIIINH